MWNSKNILLTICILILGEGSAHAAGTILHYPHGGIMLSNHEDASKACPARTRLPTIRELAKESQELGAIGILELTQVDPYSVPHGYIKISAINTDGRMDEFYYNNQGYKSPGGKLGAFNFWSSSVLSRYSDGALMMYGLDGEITYGYRYHSYDIAAIRCVPCRKSWWRLKCL